MASMPFDDGTHRRTSFPLAYLTFAPPPPRPRVTASSTNAEKPSTLQVRC